MWELTATEIGSSHALKALRSASVTDVMDILETAGVSLAEFRTLDASEVVRRFCINCKGLTKFGSKSKRRLVQFLKVNKSTILERYFVDAYCASDEELVYESAEVELDGILPTETLLIDVNLVKGGVECACIEDVISEMEQEILDSEDAFTDDTLREAVLEAIEIDEWPTDRPIYISEYAARVYPEIVVALTRSAVLVLK